MLQRWLVVENSLPLLQPAGFISPPASSTHMQCVLLSKRGELRQLGGLLSYLQPSALYVMPIVAASAGIRRQSIATLSV